MPIIQTGSTLNLTTNNNSAASNETITVPADAEIILVGFSGYADPAQASWFTGGDATVTIGGSALTAITGGDTSTSFWQAGMWYRVSPATGSQSLAWNLNGASGISGGLRVIISITFWKGIELAGAVRDTDGVQGTGNPRTSGTLTAQSGDKIVAFVGTFGNTAELAYTWSGTNVTELSELTHQNDADGSWGYADPTGNQTIAASDTTGSEGGLLSIVLIPASGGGGGTPFFTVLDAQRLRRPKPRRSKWTRQPNSGLYLRAA